MEISKPNHLQVLHRRCSKLPIVIPIGAAHRKPAPESDNLNLSFPRNNGVGHGANLQEIYEIKKRLAKAGIRLRGGKCGNFLVTLTGVNPTCA